MLFAKKKDSSNIPSNEIFGILVHLTNPFEPQGRIGENYFSAFDSKNGLIHELIALAEKNYVLSLLLSNIFSMEDVPQSIHNKLEQKYEYKTRYHKAVKCGVQEVVQTLRFKNIDHVLIKTLRPFIDDVSDIDILVPYKTSFTFLAKTFKQKGYKETGEREFTYKMKMERRIRTERHQYRIVIDFYRALAEQGLIFTDHEAVFKRRHKYILNGLEVDVPSNEDSLLMTTADAFFGKGLATLRDAYDILNLLRTNLNINYVCDTARRFGWFDGLCSVVHFLDVLKDYMTFDSSQTNTIAHILREESKKFQTISGWLYTKRVPKTFPAWYPFEWYVYTLLRKAFSDQKTASIPRLGVKTPWAWNARKIIGGRIRYGHLVK